MLPATVTAVANGRASIELGDARFEILPTLARRPSVRRPWRCGRTYLRSPKTRATASLSAVIRKSSFIGRGVEVVADTSAGELFVFLLHEKLARPVGEGSPCVSARRGAADRVVAIRRSAGKRSARPLA